VKEKYRRDGRLCSKKMNVFLKTVGYGELKAVCMLPLGSRQICCIELQFTAVIGEVKYHCESQIRY
jgi:hypothetical protein